MTSPRILFSWLPLFVWGICFCPSNVQGATTKRNDDRKLQLLRTLRYHPKFRHYSSVLDTTTTTTTAAAFEDLDVELAKAVHSAALDVANAHKRAHGHIHIMDKHYPSSSIIPLASSCASTNTRHATHKIPTTSAGNTTNAPPRFLPASTYGADPTGKQDATEAFDALLQDFLKQDPSSTTTPHMASGIVDLGGATIDLEGGQYLISKPLSIPPLFGNAHIIDGTLRASPKNFPTDRWLIEIGNAKTCQPKLPDGTLDPQGSCNEFVEVASVLLDANFVAAGGVKVDMVMGTTLSNVFVTGFVQAGIQVNQGHEVMISDAWLAECYWSDDSCYQNNNSTSIGIEILNGHDHYITNTIVFDFTKVGVAITGAANILQGVHTWNGGGVGIAIGNAQNYGRTHQTRLIGCYLDFNTLDLYDPKETIVESTFFLVTNTILHAASTTTATTRRGGGGGTIDGLIMRYNTYASSSSTKQKQSVVLEGTFTSVSRVSIVDEIGAYKSSTRATASLFQSSATEWVFDFSSILLFPTIDHVSYSIASSHSSFFSHMARPPNNGTTVTVVTSEAVDATVYMTVEQAM